MKIIAGLGNPGLEYAMTRHNCGFLTLDILEQRLDIACNRHDNDALIGMGFYQSEKLLLLKPQSYMNLSGFPLIRLANYYKVDLEDILVIYDDMDLLPGTLRLKRGGSAGGHNGMASIIEQAGSDKINRLKIGIGHSPFHKGADHVLGRFSGEEIPLMADVFAKAADAALLWTKEGIAAAMSSYNIKEEKPKKKNQAHNPLEIDNIHQISKKLEDRENL
ncbi:MAG: aminoacyl-tRNA hydrolase [Clostridiales bacterium]